MRNDLATTVVLPLVLALMMLSLGLHLDWAAFRRVFARPRGLLVGLVCHYLVLPLLTYALIRLSGADGLWAIGFMIVAACPSGTTSNLLTHLARGDVALAISFTAIASLVTMLSLPLIVNWAVRQFGADARLSADTAASFVFPTAVLMRQLLLLLVLPVLLGIFIRHRFAAIATRLAPVATKLATALLILVIVFAAIKYWPQLRDHLGLLAPLALALNLSLLTVGFLLGRIAGLPADQAITVGVETGLQNTGLALVVASTVMQNDLLAVPAGLYAIAMYVGGGLFVWLMRAITRSSAIRP